MPQSRSSTLGTRQPYSRSMERCVLGAAMTNEQALSQILALLPDSSYFYEPLNQQIYTAIKDLALRRQIVDPMTVSAQIQDDQRPDGALAELLSMVQEVPLLSSAPAYAEEVRKLAVLRRIIGVADELKQACHASDADPDQILALQTKKLYDLGQEGKLGALERLDSILRRTINELHELAREGDPYKNRLMTGFRHLDRTIGGFAKGSLNILAARPGVGKSAFALNIAQNAALGYRKSVAIFSLEMSKSEIGQRFLAMKGPLNSRIFRNFMAMTDDERHKLAEAATAFANQNIYIDDLAGSSPLDIMARCRQKKHEGQLDLVIIDYLQLMTMKSRSFSRQQEVSEISRFLKLMAKELDVPVLALSQLNRDLEKRQGLDGAAESRAPQLSDLRESGSIEQDADTVIFLYPKQSESESEEEGENPNAKKITVRIAKNRSGPIRTFDFDFFGSYFWFEEPRQKTEATHGLPSDAQLARMEEGIPKSLGSRETADFEDFSGAGESTAPFDF